MTPPDPRTLPCNEEAEVSVLGALLLDNSLAYDVIQTLKPDDFHYEGNRRIFAAMLHLHENDSPIDPVLLREELRHRGHLDLVGSSDAIINILDRVPSAAHALHYADLVRTASIKRGIIYAAKDFMDEGFNGKSPQEVLENHHVRVDDLDKEAAGSRLPIINGPDLDKTEFPERVSIVGKRLLEEGGFLSIVSEEGVGKTWLTVELAGLMATGTGGAWLTLPVAAKKMPVLVLYGEGGADGAQDRSRKVIGSIPDGYHIMTPEQLPLDLNDPRDISRLKTTVEWLKQRYNTPSVAVFVDPQANWSNHNENEDGGPFYKRLNDFRLKTRTTLIVNHHTNKQVVEKGNARSARGSSRFPAIVDAALVLNRETDGSVRVTWGKLRNAAPMEAGLFRLSPETLRFEFQSTLSQKKSNAERIFEVFEEARLSGDGWLTKRQVQISAGVNEKAVTKWVLAQEKMEKVESRGQEGMMKQYRITGPEE